MLAAACGCPTENSSKKGAVRDFDQGADARQLGCLDWEVVPGKQFLAMLLCGKQCNARAALGRRRFGHECVCVAGSLKF